MDERSWGVRHVHETWKRTSVASRCRRLGPRTEAKRTVTPTNDRKSRELYTAFTIIVVVIAVNLLLTAGLLRLADRMAPQTGDIIAFPATRVPSVSTASFAARRAIASESTSCILDVQTMQKSGGSLVVETSQFEPSRVFRVHWAGVRTSRDGDDCGDSADLLLNSNQISALIFAAGGTGVEAQH